MAGSVTPARWAASVLHGLGVRQTPGAVQALVGWARAEGGHWNNDAKYNPLNTTQPMPGAGNTGAQGNIKVYRNWQQGVDATVRTLKNGHYGGIINALRAGDPQQVASAIGQTPWGTAGSLVARTIASTPRTGGVLAIGGTGSAVGTSTTTTSGPSEADQRLGLLSNYLSMRGRPGALAALGTGLADVQAPTTTTTTSPSAASPSGTPPRGGSKLLELFWRGQGSVNVKNGERVGRDFVSGHTDHVHVAAGPKTVVALGKLAQQMGLRVGENPHFGKVNPVHVANSYHYKGEAIDVSGDPAKMRAFAHKVAQSYGIK